jgi:hypothetical protein
VSARTPQSVRDALADAETLRLFINTEGQRAIMTGVGPAYEPLRCIGWGLRVIGHIGTEIPAETTVECARMAARAAFRAVPGLR